MITHHGDRGWIVREDNYSAPKVNVTNDGTTNPNLIESKGGDKDHDFQPQIQLQLTYIGDF